MGKATTVSARVKIVALAAIVVYYALMIGWVWRSLGTLQNLVGGWLPVGVVNFYFMWAVGFALLWYLTYRFNSGRGL